MNSTFHERLASERKRLNLTQDEMARAGGCAKRTYCNYEAGEREPPASFMSAIKKAGVDIGFLMFGVHEFNTLGLAPSETRLLGLYRQLPLDKQTHLEAMALSLAQPQLSDLLLKIGADEKARSKVTVGGKVVGQVVEGDLVNQGPVVIGKNRGKKK